MKVCIVEMIDKTFDKKVLFFCTVAMHKTFDKKVLFFVQWQCTKPLTKRFSMPFLKV